MIIIVKKREDHNKDTSFYICGSNHSKSTLFILRKVQSNHLAM